MPMIRPGFLSSSDRFELEACVRRQREDHGIARRANAILLLDDGESCARIAKFLYLVDLEQRHLGRDSCVVPLISSSFASYCLQGGKDCSEQIDKKRLEIVQDLSDIVAAAAQNSEDGITAEPLEGASCQASIGLHVSDFGFYSASPSEQLFQCGRQTTSGS